MHTHIMLSNLSIKCAIFIIVISIVTVTGIKSVNEYIYESIQTKHNWAILYNKGDNMIRDVGYEALRLKSIINAIEVSYDAYTMDDILKIDIDINSIAEQLSHLQNIEKFKEVQIYFNGNHVKLKPNFRTIEEFTKLSIKEIQWHVKKHWR